MKKILLLAGAAVAAYHFFGKSDAMDQQSDDPFEGIIALAPNGNVFVIHQGKRYHLASEQSAQDYKAAFPQMAQGLSLSDQQLSPYPIVGALYPGLSFQED